MNTFFYTVAFLLISFCSFGQFKHVQNANGDPLTEIVDPNGMKQGNWNYTDAEGHNFRTEVYRDNVLVSNRYMLPGASVDVMSFKQRNIADFTQKVIKDLATSLTKAGNGEIIVLEDNSVFVYFYHDKVRSQAAMKEIDASVLKNYALQQSIIFF